MKDGRERTLDPRVVRTREVVLAAVLEELADAGHRGFSIESVAARCGVGKSTIYRHWAGRSELIVDALHTLNPQPPGDPAVAPRDRVLELLAHLVEAATEGPLAPVVPALVEAAEHDPEIGRLFHAYSDGRRAALRDAVAEGISTGAFPSHLDPDLASQALAGAVFYARLVGGAPLAAADVEPLVSTVLGPG